VPYKGQWGPLGDRFSGAVLVAEMLGWAHPKVRELAHGESYFAPDELQINGERYEILREVLRVYDPGFAEAFEQAWRSSSLDECPTIKTWYDLLDSLPRDPVAEWAPINPAEFAEPEPEPVKNRTSVSAPDLSARQKPGRNRKGCRRFVVISLVLSLLCCYATVLAAQISAAPEILNIFDRLR